MTGISLFVLSFCVCGINVTFGRNESSEDNTTARYGLDRHQHERKNLIETLFENYDARIAPASNGSSTNVTVELFILSIDSISETNMDFSVSMFLRQSWYDIRLKYEPGLPGSKLLELDTETMSRVWVPDLFIPSEKRALVHDVTVPNKLMHIYPDGKIQYSLRLSATLKCNFDLRKFPLDHQHCLVEMESYGYTTDTMRFEWSGTPVNRAPDMQIPQFFLQDITTGRCDKIYFGVGYSCVKFEIFMTRSKGYYITQIYIPSYLIVFLSWVSFWLDIEAVPARISLGLLTVLTMTTQSSGARNNLPKVSYLKAIDVWMAVCLGFVFLALVQFAYVNVLSRVEKRRKLTSCGTVGKIALGTSLSAANTGSPSPASPNTPTVTAPSLAKASLPNMSAISESGNSQQSNQDPEVGNAGTQKNRNFAQLAMIARGNSDSVKSSLGNNDTRKPFLGSNDTRQPSLSSQQDKLLFGDVVKKAQDRMRTLVSADREKARNADRISRVLFPVAFFIFNIVYWLVYVFWEPTEKPQ